MANLSRRERMVLQGVCAGRNRKELANALGITVGTLAVHIKNAYRKLGAHSRGDAINRFRAQALALQPRSAKSQFLLVLDQGVTRSRALIFNHEGEVVQIAEKPTDILTPRPGWAEQDPVALWSAQAGVAAEAMAAAGLGPFNIAAVGITNQRETTILWNRATGRPVYPAILWSDRRTREACDAVWREKGRADWLRRKTGLLPTTFASAFKIAWILDHVPGTREAARAGKLCFGTVDSWLLWNATGGTVHATDPTNASRTMLYSITGRRWDPELLRYFRIPASLLPRVRSSADTYGQTVPPFSPSDVPVTGIIGDQQASLLGLGCTKPGMVKSSYGTGCFTMMNVGDKPVASRRDLFTTVAWEIAGKPTYALEGCVFSCEATLRWLRDLFELRDAAAWQALASAPSGGTLAMLPALEGLAAPKWDPDARGILAGLTPATTRAEIVRAALEGLSNQVTDVVAQMATDSGHRVTELHLDGRNANDPLLQCLADLAQVEVRRYRGREPRALGAARIAAVAVDYWPRLADRRLAPAPDQLFTPGLSREEASDARARWHRALDR